MSIKVDEEVRLLRVLGELENSAAWTDLCCDGDTLENGVKNWRIKRSRERERERE